MNPTDSARAYVADALGKPIEDIPHDAAIGDLDGWDSLGHMRLMLLLEQKLARPLAPDEIVHIRSVSNIADLLSRTS